MKLHIIIVNYRTAALVVDCLRSLQPEIEAHGNTVVTIVDGASGDDSVAALEVACREADWTWVRVLALDVNGGFAYGNNAGIETALAEADGPEYVWLLNPDTYVRPGALMRLVDFMEARPEVGIAGSRLENPDGSPRFATFRFASPWSELEASARCGPVSRLLQGQRINPPIRDEAHATDWVSGASLLVRRQVFDDIGMLDAAYFLYYEEADFCLRAARAGWAIWHVPDSRVVHLVGQASGVTGARRNERRRPGYWFASRRRYFHKNHGVWTARAADALWLLGYALWTARRWVTRSPHIDPPRLARDFCRWSLRPGRTS